MKTRVEGILWLIDSNHWERAIIRAELLESGFEVEGFESISRALLMYHMGIVKRPDLIILDNKNLAIGANELEGLSGIGAPLVLLTGVYVKKPTFGWAAVLIRPFTVEQVVETVEHLLVGNHEEQG